MATRAEKKNEETAAVRGSQRVAPPPEGIASRREFLVVDDDEQLVRSVRRRLAQNGFETRAAIDIESAVREIAKRAPDFVLLDVHLGEVNGLDRIDDLRAAGFGGPVIVLSGDSSFAMAHRAAIAGADGYLLKGVEDVIPELLRCLERRAAPGGSPEMMPVSAMSYLATRGLTAWELALAAELAKGGAKEKEIAARTGRSDTAVRKGFESIRKKLGAGTQLDLSRMIGVLSCFGRRR
jgi:DNA-binding NarL/FixJ family response regulator